MSPSEATPAKRRPTATSDFGVGRREGHDSSDFYARFHPPEISDDATLADDPTVRAIDRVFQGSSADMAQVADGSVALVVTSPPYFAGKAYETELDAEHVPATYLEYLQMLRDVFGECVRKLEPGGRIAVNVANLGRRPYRSLASDITAILQDDLRLLLRGEIVWVKQRGASGSCAWGSFQRATNPVLRDLTERVIIASKGRFDRAVPVAERQRRSLPSTSTVHRDEFMDATLDLWEIPPESARRVGHPAPFPVALPQRLIHLYTYAGDLVLDPFMGSGTTGVAAVRTGRHYAGYDTDADYVRAATARIDAERADAEQARAPADAERAGIPADDVGSRPGGHLVAGPQVPSTAAADEDVFASAAREGSSAKDLARELLELAGFTRVESGPKVSGVEMTFAGRDADDRRLVFDLCGAFTSARPGLKRPETLWRSVGRASTVRLLAADDDTDAVVLLTTDLPARVSSSGRALSAAVGAGGPVLEVATLDPDGLSVLEQLAKGLRPGSPGWGERGWSSATSSSSPRSSPAQR